MVCLLSSRFIKNRTNIKNVQEVQAYLDQEIEQSHLLEILSLLYLPKDLYNEILNASIQVEIFMIMQVMSFIV